MPREFEWEPLKAAANARKHGVTFDEAKTVFDDPKCLELYDLEHSLIEDRHLLIGCSKRLRLLLVVSTERYETIRIISARKANAKESRRYESGY